MPPFDKEIQADRRLLMLAESDNVAIATEALDAGDRLMTAGGDELELKNAIGRGHKVALVDLSPGNKILKYGVSIGSATCAIARGEHVHTHNLASDYIPIVTYSDHDPQKGRRS